jgi:hypothetical protein
MSTYTVVWTIDVEADTPEEAAQIARGYQLNPESTATCFSVSQDQDSSMYFSGGWEEFDLSLEGSKTE